MTLDRPNFLLITTDQQRADYLGCYGAKVLQTPNVDALALRGTRFENAYVASPVCMPNRASLMTGRMPSLHGLRHNGLNLDLGATTFAEILRTSGWKTSLSGKPHFQCVTQAPALMNDAEKALPAFEARTSTPGRYDQETGILWRQDPGRGLDLPYYGFDTIDLAVGHGDQVDGHYSGWLEENGLTLDAIGGPGNALSHDGPNTLQAWRTAVPEEFYPTRYVQIKTIEHLQRYAQSPDEPFFHWASFCDPHHPFTPPGRYWDMYQPQDVELPASFNKATKSAFVRDLYDQRHNGSANVQGTAAIAVSEEELRAAIALTYGMISMIDDAIGEIVATLRSAGIAENTIIVFLSDHGDLMGDHGLIFKGPYHYRGLIRTPLIWADPSKGVAQTQAAPVSAIDVPASILEAAGLEPHSGMQGRPFVSRDGDTVAARSCILIEDEIQSNLPGQSTRCRVRTLLSDGWRVSIYDGLELGELYNLNADPMELENLWNDPAAAHRRAVLTEALLREMITHSETSPKPIYAA